MTREDRWWVIKVFELHGLAHADRYIDVERMARAHIAMSTGLPHGDIEVRIVDPDAPPTS